jgi:hypothetical protein
VTPKHQQQKTIGVYGFVWVLVDMVGYWWILVDMVDIVGFTGF